MGYGWLKTMPKRGSVLVQFFSVTSDNSGLSEWEHAHESSPSKVAIISCRQESQDSGCLHSKKGKMQSLLRNFSVWAIGKDQDGMAAILRTILLAIHMTAFVHKFLHGPGQRNVM